MNKRAFNIHTFWNNLGITGKRTAIGGALGTLTGAVIGSSFSKNKLRNTLIGSLAGGSIGAGAGYLSGRHTSKLLKDRRDAAEKFKNDGNLQALLRIDKHVKDDLREKAEYIKADSGRYQVGIHPKAIEEAVNSYHPLEDLTFNTPESYKNRIAQGLIGALVGGAAGSLVSPKSGLGRMSGAAVGALVGGGAGYALGSYDDSIVRGTKATNTLLDNLKGDKGRQLLHRIQTQAIKADNKLRAERDSLIKNISFANRLFSTGLSKRMLKWPSPLNPKLSYPDSGAITVYEPVAPRMVDYKSIPGFIRALVN